jgi:sarcosine oxidase
VRAGDRTVVADKVVVCAGMWSAELLGEPFKSLLRVCRQQLFWFKLEEPVIFPEVSPSFILSHGPLDTDFCYGFPPIPGEGSMKIATEQYTALSEPDSLDRTVSDADVAAMFRTHVAGKIAGVTAERVKASVCTYTVTPDYGFIIDEHPALKNVTVVSACSGHGFKHSAAIGEAVAQRCLSGKSQIDLSAFSLSRFS